MKSPFTREVLQVVGHGPLKRLVLSCGHDKELFGFVVPRRAKCATCEKAQRPPKARAKRAADR